MMAVSHNDKFEALDACHADIQQHLDQLKALMPQIEAGADDKPFRQQIAAIEAFFSSTSRDHHADEEKNVFPALLARENAELTHAVHTLQQDHGWIEQNWIQLAPMMRAIADGSGTVDPAEFKHSTEVFVALLHDHIVLEETLIYPESKRQFSDELAARETRKGELT